MEHSNMAPEKLCQLDVLCTQAVEEIDTGYANLSSHEHYTKSYRPFEVFVNVNCKIRNECNLRERFVQDLLE